MNYRVIWVFPKRKFGVALHILNPHTGKILHLHLTIYQQMWEIISFNLFDDAATKDCHFLCLLWSVIFLRGSVGSIVTKFFGDFFYLFWSWINARQLSQLWFSLQILSFELQFMFALTILLSFAFLLTVLLTVLKLHCYYIFSWFCNFYNWIKWIIYFRAE